MRGEPGRDISRNSTHGTPMGRSYPDRLRALERHGSMFHVEPAQAPDPYHSSVRVEVIKPKIGVPQSRAIAGNGRTRKKKFYLLQRGRCQYCIRKFTLQELTWDHVVPRSKGGTSQRENLVLACHKCNNLKGARDVGEFLLDLVRHRLQGLI